MRVLDPLHPSFFEGMSTVTKFYLDGLLQVGTAGLMQTAAVLLRGPSSTTIRYIRNTNPFFQT